MSTDAQMLQRADALLLRVVDGVGAWQLVDAQLREDISEWRRDYARHGEQSRWRPIASDGTIDPEPAPETPDEPNEGETGPPEVTA